MYSVFIYIFCRSIVLNAFSKKCKVWEKFAVACSPFVVNPMLCVVFVKIDLLYHVIV